ncbi:MAG: CoA-binding protein [Chloroflexi bacterium]|nr:CoA-binding protein [Chloroflexota bacterium]
MRGSNLDLLFHPRSLALIGASRDEGKAGGRLLKSLLNYGFEGRILPVKPGESEVMDLRCYPSILDVPGEVDLAMLVTPAAVAPDIIRECARKGVKFAIIHSAGFGELGVEGRERQARVLEAARSGGVRIVGPNCMGLYNPQAHINTITPEVVLPAETGAVACFGQSGWVTENFILSGRERGLRFSKVVSSGNQIDLSTVDYLEYFGADPQTKVIGAYIEGIKDGCAFLRAAMEVSSRKPVIIWKPGASEVGARAVATHTGSLAGSDAIFAGAARQAGVLRAHDLEELIDLALAFSSPCLPQGNRVGLLGESGGGAAAAADACGSLGLEAPVLPEDIQRQLKDLLAGVIPPSAGIANPVDLVWPPYDESPRLFLSCLDIMAPAVDSFLIINYYPMTEEKFLADLASLRDRTGRPMVVVPGHPALSVEGMSLYSRRGIPAYPTPERAARALAALWRYERHIKAEGA